MGQWIRLLIIIAVFSLSGAYGKTLNGFNLKDSLVPAAEIYSGGPPKDGIPAIHQPSFISAKEALEKYDAKAKAIFVSHGGVTRAYPLAILVWHEMVNDTISGKPLIITYCPLCGSGITFEQPTPTLKFGVSGLLFQSDMLLYDRETQSLWSQIMRKAISGPKKGEVLKVFHSEIKLLHKTLRENPKVQVLSSKTGYKRAYWRNPYKGYEDSEATYYPIKNQDKAHHPKDWTLWLRGGKRTFLIPMSNLPGNKFEFELHELKTKFKYNKKSRTFECPAAVDVECFAGYWFALRAFYPRATVIKNSEKAKR